MAERSFLAADLRRSRRKSTCKLGAIQVDNCSPDIECLVWDVSEGGAKIEPLSVNQVPNEFEIFIDEQDVRRSCAVIWRKKRKIGVAFVI
jgi:hypothetical protein